MRSKLTFEDFVAGDSFTLGNEIKVNTTLLRHPDNATGYRIDYGGKSFCYVTDTEHIPGKPDENILNLIDHADVVVYDCTYTRTENFLLELVGAIPLGRKGCAFANLRMLNA